jgi:hypothetical protein
MNAAQAVCASSGKVNAWEQVDRTQCGRRVRRLQARIVKATVKETGSALKSGALQRLEPDEGKLSRPVLRGGSGSNVTPLPDVQIGLWPRR